MQRSTTAWALSSQTPSWRCSLPTSSATTPFPRTACPRRSPRRLCPSTVRRQTLGASCRTCEIARPIRGGGGQLTCRPQSTATGSCQRGLSDVAFSFASLRSGVLTRHRSMTESSQGLRQIEMPKKTTRAVRGRDECFTVQMDVMVTGVCVCVLQSKVCVPVEKPAAEAKKQETQGRSSWWSEQNLLQPSSPASPSRLCPSAEVTKVRRNLFNQELVSPSKKAKLPRCRSVSAVEGLKRSHDPEGKRCQDVQTNETNPQTQSLSFLPQRDTGSSQNQCAKLLCTSRCPTASSTARGWGGGFERRSGGRSRPVRWVFFKLLPWLVSPGGPSQRRTASLRSLRSNLQKVGGRDQSVRTSKPPDIKASGRQSLRRLYIFAFICGQTCGGAPGLRSWPGDTRPPSTPVLSLALGTWTAPCPRPSPGPSWHASSRPCAFCSEPPVLRLRPLTPVGPAGRGGSPTPASSRWVLVAASRRPSGAANVNARFTSSVLESV